MRKIIFLSLYCIVLILVGEVALRLILPLERQRRRYSRTRDVFQYHRNHIQFDPELGYSLKPDLATEFRNPEFATSVRTNSYGLREDEASLSDPEILLLGDSFGFGWGVEKEESCEAVLEKLSGALVLNLSVPGYGTLQEFLALKRYGADHDLSGKTAFFLIYPNDITENMGFGFNAYPTLDGNVIKHPDETGFTVWFPTVTGSMYGGLFRHSYILYLARSLLDKLKKTGPPPEEDDPFVVFDNLVSMIKEYADDKNLRLLFVWVPSIKYFEDGSGRYGSYTESGIFENVERLLAGYGIPLIDLRLVLWHDDYYFYDGHWTPDGHEKAALAIHHFLDKHL